MGNVLKPLTEDPLSFAYEPLLSSPMDKENEDLRVFSVTELKKATNNFRKDRVVHEEDGSVRTFYKGSIDDTSSRTKKRISVFVMECLQDSLEAIEAWKVSKEEVKSLGEHSHPNIVTFLGYCCEDKKSLLVFEYLHQGTLDHHINGTEKEVLSWETRVKIAIGIAKGVAFLHSFYNSSLYFELRMHNIMLDEEYNAKLFYLETDKKCLENCLTIYGHRYMPHECLVSGCFKMDTDVYAFGVILLELFTCSKDEDLLAHLLALRNGAKKLEKNKSLDVRETRPFLFTEIIDPRLEGDYPVNAAMQMGTLIQRCTKCLPTRPSMQQVLDVLNDIAEIN
ncbi:putative inactive serine/threonine-protein kinase At5g11400 isoform X4 [Brassica rapa]|uniref:putative inactive serine/threonine-protein kinase At5g11400 isoform X4 n=1 Tax=Brassica campestris TaxID=3711 RepID=UPI00142E1D38|nr:putative inactive serine/threonine-protein kinase At5g11400 isoform X4 [Brassica rapa]